MARKQKTIWAYDCETDPFKYGRAPRPFAWAAVSEFGERVLFWGDNSTQEFIAWLRELEDALLIAHNGGKFDSLFLKDAIAGQMLMVDGRIIKCNVSRSVELRDSFAILPMPLRNLGAKYDIEYSKLERECREFHREEITRYLIQDCEVLLAAVLDFYQRAGKRRLTIASQASHELRAYYPDLPKLTETHHAEFSRFYYGGRVQAFEKGIITGDFQLYDVNSMYPAVMAQEYHPFGASYRQIPFSKAKMPADNCGFFLGTCDSLGAFPVRLENKTTPYLHGRVEIAVTLHEVRAALETGTAKNFSGSMLLPEFKTTFDKFVHDHYTKRQAAKERGDKGGDIYHKLILNSSYGRFAMSPEGRDDTYYAEHDEDLRDMLAGGWRIGDIDLECERYILKRPPQRPWMFYEDVATGASITGAARARLLRGIAASGRALYCDTDSLLCEDFGGEVDGKKLGAWKFEAECDTAAIAGKKTYVLLKNKRPIKQACKGVRACPTEIYMAAAGDTVEIERDAPTMRLAKNSFVKREIRMT